MPLPRQAHLHASSAPLRPRALAFPRAYASATCLHLSLPATGPRHNNAHAFARAAFEEIGFALKSLGKLDGRDLRGELILLGEQVRPSLAGG